RGKHPKIQSLWNHEDIAAQVGSYIRSNKSDITPKNLREHVNGTILPNIGVDNEDKQISESTAERWLRRLGWVFGTYKKGFYFDESHEILEIGSNIWWTTEKLKDQIINKAIPIFNATHPNCTALFAFDNATSHAAFASNALVASKMNWNDGGSQPTMRNTVFDGAEQKMVHPDGKQKGMRTILTERGLYKDGLRKIKTEN
ncbi:12289_t:CDS:2, partial [Entrophospora sp. SA101]